MDSLLRIVLPLQSKSMPICMFLERLPLFRTFLQMPGLRPMQMCKYPWFPYLQLEKFRRTISLLFLLRKCHRLLCKQLCLVRLYICVYITFQLFQCGIYQVFHLKPFSLLNDIYIHKNCDVCIILFLWIYFVLICFILLKPCIFIYCA